MSWCRTLTDYLESLQRSGGEPHVIEPSKARPADALAGLDGLLLTGGGDIDPARYGERRHPTTEEAEPGRDEFELELAVRAVEADLPLLAVCRGIQVLNVAHGGTLLQDIPSEVPAGLTHALNEPRAAPAHDVWIVKGSRLWHAMRERLDEQDACPVNSRHHQAIKQVAAGFEVTATAPDGVIEAIERTDSRFCVGVQWHPENFWRTGEFRGLFEAFLEACTRR